MKKIIRQFTIELNIEETFKHIYNFYNSRIAYNKLIRYDEDKYILEFQGLMESSIFEMKNIDSTHTIVDFTYSRLTWAKISINNIITSLLECKGKLFTTPKLLPVSYDIIDVDDFKDKALKFMGYKLNYIVEGLKDSKIMIEKMMEYFENTFDEYVSEFMITKLNVNSLITLVSYYLHDFCIVRLLELCNYDINKIYKKIEDFCNVLTYNYMKKNNNIDYFDILYNINAEKQYFIANAKYPFKSLDTEITTFIFTYPSKLKKKKDFNVISKILIDKIGLSDITYTYKSSKEFICKLIKYSDFLTENILEKEYIMY